MPDPGVLLRHAWRWVLGLPRVWQATLLLAVAAIVGAGGLYVSETYEYVQHDNDFCLSCHLMERPYERFARSAHQELSCKACHQPTLGARTQMALRQIVEQPDTLTAHAEVPNERCAECHIEGDPEKWQLIKQTAGHQLHLESDDPALSGLQCVQCHSTSLHEFAPTRETCAQSGCHADVEIRLGGMSDLTIHCVACHDFTQPLPPVRTAAIPGAREDEARARRQSPPPPEEAAQRALRPDREQCLGCHSMRAMVDIPASEPHDGACGTCHDAHEHTRPAQAVGSCAEAGCHARADTLPNFHHQRPTVRIAECTRCHRAHRFRIQEENCLACHQEIFTEERTSSVPSFPEEPTSRGRATAPPDAEGPVTRGREPAPPPPADAHRPVPVTGPRATGNFALASVVELAAALEAAASPAGAASSPGGRAPPRRDGPASGQDTVRFRHDDHRELDCQACHQTGQPTVTTNPRFCRECHHTGPRATACRECHQEREIRSTDFGVRQTLRFSMGVRQTRELSFRHEPHLELDCAECHSGPPTLGAAEIECTRCHEEHHRPEARCNSCHRAAPDSAHPLEVHTSCTGSGCHEGSAVPALASRTREFCTACHQEMTDHRPGRACVACHVLPEMPAPPGSRREGGGS